MAQNGTIPVLDKVVKNSTWVEVEVVTLKST